MWTYKQNKLTPLNYKNMIKMIQAKEELSSALGLAQYPMIFKNGDSVYYIKDPVLRSFGQGILIEDTFDYVLIHTSQGEVVRVSPFALLPNPHGEKEGSRVDNI